MLYLALDSVLGTHGYASAILILDHRAIAGLTLELADLVRGSPLAFERRAPPKGAASFMRSSDSLYELRAMSFTKSRLCVEWR